MAVVNVKFGQWYNNTRSSCIGEGDAMERMTKGRVKGSRWSGSNNEEDCGVDGKCNGSSSCGGGASDGEEGYIFRAPLNSNGHSSRKRLKLQAKVAEDCKPVDPAMVPRRLRSAITKRPRQSVSPPLSDSKREQLHALNETQLSNGYIAERFRQNKLDQVTKDEEEVAVALTMLASPISESKLIKNKENMITLEENSETKEALTCFSEAPKEEPTNFLLPCNGSIGTNSSPCVEESDEDVLKAQPSALGQQIAASISQNFDAGMNQTSQPDFCTTPLSMNGKGGDVTSLRDDAKKSSSSLGTSLQYLAGNGKLQEIQVGASSMRRPDVGLWPLGSAPVELDLQSVKQKLERETTPVMWPGLPSSSHGHLTIPSSETTGCPKSVSASARHRSTTNEPPTEMLSSIDRKAPRKKCATHVYISHIIRNYQSTEKRLQASQPVNQSKAKEGTSSTSQTARGPAGLRNNKVHQSIGFHIEKSSIQDSTQMLHDGRILQAQLLSTVSGARGQQKQVGEFLSMSAAGDAKDSGNGSKSLSGQFNVPYLPPHSLRPFPFARGPYPSYYQDQLAAAASHQVQLQLPHFVGTSPMYGPQMVHTTGGTTTKQQQQMWQAQMAHYRPTLGFPAKWQQNGQHPDSFPSSPSLRTQPPPSNVPLPKDYQPAKTQQHFLLPVPPLSSPLPSRANQQQQHQHNVAALNLEGSTQLQMLCSAETFR